MKRKGFTLIELLGVIVVLAVIAIITTPVILGVIEKSKKGALQSSGYGLVEAGILYHAEYQNSQTVRFDIKNNQIRTKEENKIDYKGSIKDGTILINNQGEVTVCINDGKYAAYKNYKDNKIIVVDQKTCTVPENNYIVYLDNESTIKEMTNAEITSAITKLTERVNQLEKDKATLEEENKKLKEQNGDTEINSTITNSIVDLRNNLNTKADIASLNTKLDINTFNNRMGSTNISNLGNDITSAISKLGLMAQGHQINPVNDLNNFYGIGLFSDIQHSEVLNMPTDSWYMVISAGDDCSTVQLAVNLWDGAIYFRNRSACKYDSWKLKVQ